LNPAYRSAGALDEPSALEEPANPPAIPTRPDARRIQPAPRAAVVVVPRPAKPASAGAVTSGGSGWRHDPEVSWYGPGFYGHRTACGYALTTTLIGVAHRTLPCGTKIVFRNPASGRTVTARVVDRGPYVAGRQWDMTGGLCVALDHCYTGPMDWRFG
jgi:rare lipoprotein A (peptidoglycan hydrolase)